MNIKNYREKELTYYTILLIIIIFISTDILPIEELLKNKLKEKYKPVEVE